MTTTQLALAWLRAQWDGIITIPGSTRVEGVKEAVASAQVKLTAQDLAEVRALLDRFPVQGSRSNKHMAAMEAL